MTDTLPGIGLRVALRRMVYEATHLSPCKPNGDHDCTITADALAEARAALSVPDQGQLREALATLEHCASEVHRLGARGGTQWFRLTGALIIARAALSDTLKENSRG